MVVKVLATGIASLLLLVLGLPLLTGAAATAPPSPSGDITCVGGAVLDRALATIRTLESGSRYDLPPGSGGASGAYQYLGSTWRRWASSIGIDIAKYPAAYLAPPPVQDAVATANVTAILGGTDDVARIPVAWYWPRALTHPEDLDIVPAPYAGNRLTVREYRDRWLKSYGGTSTESEHPCPTSAATEHKSDASRAPSGRS
jgi:hypothetical protein